MARRTRFAALMLFISIAALVSLYGWVTAVPAHQEPVAIPIVINQGSWSVADSPLLELPTSNEGYQSYELHKAILIKEIDHSP